jgi:hypothetical protein
MGGETVRIDHARRMSAARMQIARASGMRRSGIRGLMTARQSAVMRAPGSAARNPSVWVDVAGKIWPAGMTGPHRGSEMSEVWAAAAADVDVRRKMRAATAADMRRKMRTTATADMRNAATTWVWTTAATRMRTTAATRMRTTAATWMAAGPRTVLSLGVSRARRQRCQ